MHRINTQTMIAIDSPFFLKPEELPKQPDWSVVFGNDRPLALEIGCGIGDFVAKTAADFPELNFIALDFYNKGCYKTCRRIEKAGLTNVRVGRFEARQFIVDHLPLASLHKVFINCPDPWPKQRHRKRRLVQPSFVRFLAPYLVAGADFHFATDFNDYGIDVAGFMPQLEEFENCLAPDLYRHELEGYHRTKYMLKFMAHGSRIYFVHYRKV